MRPAPRARFIALLATTAAVASAATVRADAIFAPERDDCVPGTTARVGHCHSVCAPLVCEGSRDCPAGFACDLVQLCMGPLQEGCGWISGSLFEDVLADCSERSCESGGCSFRTVCRPVPDAGPTDAGAATRRHESWGCDCRLARTPGLRAAPLVVAAVVLATTLRRAFRGRRRAHVDSQ